MLRLRSQLRIRSSPASTFFVAGDVGQANIILFDDTGEANFAGENFDYLKLSEKCRIELKCAETKKRRGAGVKDAQIRRQSVVFFSSPPIS